MKDKFTRIVIWKLDNLIVDLESVIPLLELDYTQELDFLEGYLIPDRDKKLFHKWESTNGNNFNIRNKNFFGQNIRFLEASAYFEISYGSERSFQNEILLDRRYRIFNNYAKVVFVELNGSVYCLIETTQTNESRIRSALMGQRKGNRIEEWGNIEYKNVPFFKFDTQFFYWLISKKGSVLFSHSSEPEQTTEMKLVDVSALTLVGDRSVYDSNNQGANLLTESPTALSGLGCNNDVQLVGIKLVFDETTILFRFESNGTSYINVDRTQYYDAEERIIGIDDDFPYFIIAIFGSTFPILLEKFHREKRSTNWEEVISVQRKKWALKAIKELCLHNEISTLELDSLLNE